MGRQYKLFAQPESPIPTISASGPDLPILIETLERPFFPMVRCHYLSFEYADPRQGLSVRLAGGSTTMPFLLLGLVGIIQQPLGQQKFTSPELIDQLFEQFEDKVGLLINFEDIWLPNFMFNRRTEVGDVYRIGNELFQHAYRFREGRLREKVFLEDIKKFEHSLLFSEDETEAFAQWNEKQVFRAQNLGPKNPELQLPVRDDYRNKH